MAHHIKVNEFLEIWKYNNLKNTYNLLYFQIWKNVFPCIILFPCIFISKYIISFSNSFLSNIPPLEFEKFHMHFHLSYNGTLEEPVSRITEERKLFS